MVWITLENGRGIVVTAWVGVWVCDDTWVCGCVMTCGCDGWDKPDFWGVGGRELRGVFIKFCTKFSQNLWGFVMPGLLWGFDLSLGAGAWRRVL